MFCDGKLPLRRSLDDRQSQVSGHSDANIVDAGTAVERRLALNICISVPLFETHAILVAASGFDEMKSVSARAPPPKRKGGAI